MYNYKQLSEKYVRAKTYHIRWVGLWQSAYDFVLPDRNGFNELFNYFDAGIRTQEKIFDATPEIAAITRAVELKSILLPTADRWGQLQAGNNSNIPQSQLDLINDTFDDVIAMSNLSQQATSSMLDFNIGTGAIWLVSGGLDELLNFTSISTAQAIPEYHSSGRVVDGWYVEKKSHEEIENNPDYDQSVVKNLEKRGTYYVSVGNIWENDIREWRHVEFIDGDFEKPLYDKCFPYKKLHIFRDWVRPGEVHGRGFALTMLPSITDLNKMVRTDREAFYNRANPPLFKDHRVSLNYHDDNKLSGKVFTRPPNVAEPLTPTQFPDYASVQETIQALRSTIMDAAKTEPLGPVQSPVKSATEISIRQDAAQRYVQSDMSRLTEELARPLFMNSILIMARAKMLPLSLEDVKKGILSNSIRFHFQSPLKDISQSKQVSNVTQVFEILQQFLGEESVLASVNIGELRDFLVKTMKIPDNLLKSAPEINKFLQNLMAAQQQQQQPQGALPAPMASAQPIPPQIPQGIDV